MLEPFFIRGIRREMIIKTMHNNLDTFVLVMTTK